MKKVLPLVLLFAVLIYILPLAALFFHPGKTKKAAPVQLPHRPPPRRRSRTVRKRHPRRSPAPAPQTTRSLPCSFWTKTPERWRRYPCGTLCAAQWRPKCP